MLPTRHLTIRPNAGNGLKAESQIMVDKIAVVRREHIRKKIGKLPDAEMAEVDRALRLWLELGVS